MKTESYNVGDPVRKTADHAARYPSWKDKEGTIVSVRMRTILDKDLQSSEKYPYHSRYGYQEKYPIFDMIVHCSGKNYLVSQFGFNKD